MDWIQQWQSKLNKQNGVAPLVRTGGSRHTGLAALPYRNIHSRIATRGAQTSAKPFFTLFPVSETASAKILPRTFSTHSSRVRRRTLCAPVLSRSPRRADPPA